MINLGKNLKNKIIGHIKSQEAKILIYLFIIIEILFIFDAIFKNNQKPHALLVNLSIIPWVYLIFWSCRSKLKLLGISAIFGCIIFII
jgi:hypothetical protein